MQTQYKTVLSSTSNTEVPNQTADPARGHAPSSWRKQGSGTRNGSLVLSVVLSKDSSFYLPELSCSTPKVPDSRYTTG